ncbi:MAG: hypothetical protein ACTSU5_18770, partial [Promethearchaeota archaeon]
MVIFEMAYDSFFKQLVRDFLKPLEVRAEVPVGKLPLRIDLVVILEEKGGKTLPLPLLTSHFSYTNVLEFKSSRDRPSPFDLPKVLGYLGLLCSQEGIPWQDIPERCTVWYISVKRPKFFDELESTESIARTEKPGLYENLIPFPCPFFLLVVNELELEAENFPLLLSASGPRFKEALERMIAEEFVQDPIVQSYLTLYYLMNYEGVREMTEIEDVLPADLRENIRIGVEKLGLERVLDAVGLERVLDAVGLERVLDAVGLERVVEVVGLKRLKSAIR